MADLEKHYDTRRAVPVGGATSITREEPKFGLVEMGTQNVSSLIDLRSRLVAILNTMRSPDAGGAPGQDAPYPKNITLEDSSRIIGELIQNCHDLTGVINKTLGI